MIYETKILHFYIIRAKVSNDSQCSRTLPMKVAIKRNSCKDWVWSKMCGNHSWNVIKGRESIVSKCGTDSQIWFCKMGTVDDSHDLCPNSPSYIVVHPS